MPGVFSSLELLLSDNVKEIICVQDPNRIPEFLSRHRIDVILLDMNFHAGINTGNEGFFWLQRIREIEPLMVVVMLTAYGDIEAAVKAVKQGAFDYITKPWDNPKLIATIHAALSLSRISRESQQFRRRSDFLQNEVGKHSDEFVAGTSPAMVKIMNSIQKVAPTDANVLLTGENGTGKDMIASEIHRLSLRSKNLMVTIDMGSILETLFESELFGHVKGAFTDARNNRQGKIELANQGTLYLNEIGNLPMSLQTKILSVIQNREIQPLGSNSSIPVDIRLICATNSNLEEAIDTKLFREDLFYRINTISIEIPPLRSRSEDIPDLANHFLAYFSKKYKKGEMVISRSAMDRLNSHTWPGNVRELRHTIEKAVIMSGSRKLEAHDIMISEMRKMASGTHTTTLDDMERDMIRKGLAQHNGNLSLTASSLGITRQTLYNKVKKYGI